MQVFGERVGVETKLRALVLGKVEVRLQLRQRGVAQ